MYLKGPYRHQVHTVHDSQLKPNTPHATQEIKPMYKSEDKKKTKRKQEKQNERIKKRSKENNTYQVRHKLRRLASRGGVVR